jgi:hypothetical protein
VARASTLTPAHGEANEPKYEENSRHDPKDVERKASAEENEYEQKCKQVTTSNSPGIDECAHGPPRLGEHLGHVLPKAVIAITHSGEFGDGKPRTKPNGSP